MTPASAWVLTATPSPTQSPDPASISPGLIGFLATFGLVVVCLLLFVSMVRRLRRLQYRAQRDARADEAQTDDVQTDDAQTDDGRADEQR